MYQSNVTVIGAGYVGMPTALSLAYFGHKVTLVDTNQERVDALRQGQSPVFEPYLPEMMANLNEKVQYTTSMASAVSEAEFIFFAVGTPSLPDGHADLTSLNDAVHQVLTELSSCSLKSRFLVVKSTVPVGTADQIKEVIAAKGLTHVKVASNPEFLRQGSAFADTLFPERIVVGGEPEVQAAMHELYRPLIEQSFAVPQGLVRPPSLSTSTYLSTSNRSAELAKYAANAFLAMKISFINEIANVCDGVGADVDEVAQVIGADSRIGSSFLRAGLGYGGSCFPKDTRALTAISAESQYEFRLLNSVIEVNRQQALRVVEKLERCLEGVKGKRVAVLGLAFKPHTDDVRESPGIALAHELMIRGATVTVHDPQALPNAETILHRDILRAPDLGACLEGQEGVLVTTDWPEYLQMDFKRVKQVMSGSWIIDGRNCLSEDAVVSAGLDYMGVGKGAQKPPAQVAVAALGQRMHL